MNGEVIVVRPDLAPKFDKTHSVRIREAIGKVEDLAEREPRMEDQMQGYLLRTK